MRYDFRVGKINPAACGGKLMSARPALLVVYYRRAGDDDCQRQYGNEYAARYTLANRS